MSVEIIDTTMGKGNSVTSSSLIRAGLALLLFVAPLAVWLSTIGNPITYLHFDLPPGQILYVISKLLGLYAVMFLWLQLMYGLLGKDKLTENILPRWSIPSHRLLGLVVLGATLLHFALFFTAASIRKKAFLTHLLVPDFSHGFYSAVVSLGLVALVLMIVVVVAGLLRRYLGKHWIWVHRLSLVVLILVLLHSILIGSETGTLLWMTFYLVAVSTLLFALIQRIRLNPSKI